MDINRIVDKYQSSIDDVNRWTDEYYDKYFKPYFENVEKVRKCVESTVKPISDADLKCALLSIPLDVIQLSDNLSYTKTNLEVIKSGLASSKLEFEASLHNDGVTASECSRMMKAKFVDDELLINLYTNIINKVERQISFSRELIMSMKKIWDSRIAVEEADPINPIDESAKVNDLPTYIK